jgi:hypothetical protein
MNILITLPKHLLEKIISGEKQFEMRKCLPRHMKIGEDGFFVVEKGTNEVKCWCRVDKVIRYDVGVNFAGLHAQDLCVSREYIARYANGREVYLWKIGKIIKLEDLCRDSLFVDKNPQQFAYCPLSYGESF